ncbi:putative Ig domain-containing protein [Hamadaea tsunoensis]|uniref:putative Ig domain-containing protein n=1 Tax=Hamadaea tsunoensis TaxID=53368 RepID=UPI0003FE4A29|nr:putative Ig domain-containing protein [Hamadaea tsunoensis]
MLLRRFAITLGATVLGAALLGAPAPAHADTLQAASLNATIALSNCSASLVRFPTSVDTDRAMMLTNGHCYEGGMPGAGVVLTNKSSTRSGTLLNSTGGSLGTVKADLVLYATMTNTDVTLYRLNTTFASIKSSYGVTALTVSSSHPVDGSSMYIPSSYWKQIWNCSVNGFVSTLREDAWTWHDSIRYSSGCNTTHGTSGSPIIDLGSNQIVGINNTGNDDGQMCTLNNPCEVDADGTTHAYQGQSYGQETYWFTTCLTSANAIDLNKAGCLLPGGTPTGNTVTVTNPGAQSAVVGTAYSKQIVATDSASGQTLTYSATGLPAGLTINSATGLISGTPTAAASTSVTVTAKDTTNASGSATFSFTVTSSGGGCSGQLLGNGGFETGTASPWTTSSGVLDNSASEAAHAGSWKAWLNGYGSTHTDTLAQSVTIPAGCHATLTYWLHIDTAETTTTTQYDKLTLTAGSTTLATFSNLNKGTGYTQRTTDLSAYAGQTVALKFTGVEDSSLQTSFVIDDAAVTLS